MIKHAFNAMNEAALGLEKLDVPPAEKIKMAIHALLEGLEKNENTAYYHLIISQTTVSESVPEDALNPIYCLK